MCSAEVVPFNWLPKSKDVGVTVISGDPADTPVPFKVVVPVALPLAVTVAETAPAATGWKLNPAVQIALGAKMPFWVQVVLSRTNTAFDTVMKLVVFTNWKLAVPVFLKVTVISALPEPTLVFGKLTGFGVS